MFFYSYRHLAACSERERIIDSCRVRVGKNVAQSTITCLSFRRPQRTQAKIKAVLAFHQGICQLCHARRNIDHASTFACQNRRSNETQDRLLYFTDVSCTQYLQQGESPVSGANIYLRYSYLLDVVSLISYVSTVSF